ncbi:FprA family A-type flavoprotein, partial [Candidatus Bathyarchaeota archaeon]
MAPRMVAEGVYWVGALDWDRRLFDELIPLPDGTSYNAYLIQGAKWLALIDTVDPSKVERLLDSLRDLNIEWIDYVVANHAEQDHSGGIPEILEAYPEASVVATPRCKELLMDLLHLPEEKIKTVEDGE